VTLNDLERRNSPYFAFFSPNSIALQADYVTVVENRPIMSVKYCLPVSFPLLAKTNVPCCAVFLRWLSILSSLGVAYVEANYAKKFSNFRARAMNDNHPYASRTASKITYNASSYRVRYNYGRVTLS